MSNLRVGGGYQSGFLNETQLSGNHSEMQIGNTSVFFVSPACYDCNVSISVESNVCTVTAISRGTAQYLAGDPLTLLQSFLIVLG